MTSTLSGPGMRPDPRRKRGLDPRRNDKVWLARRLANSRVFRRKKGCANNLLAATAELVGHGLTLGVNPLLAASWIAIINQTRPCIQRWRSVGRWWRRIGKVVVRPKPKD